MKRGLRLNIGRNLEYFLSILLIYIFVTIHLVSTDSIAADYNPSPRLIQKAPLKKTVKRALEDNFLNNEELGKSISKMNDGNMMYPPGSTSFAMTSDDKQKLQNIFGPSIVNEHEKDFGTIKEIGIQEGAHEHVMFFISGIKRQLRFHTTTTN
jgi:hypothetical protein